MWAGLADFVYDKLPFRVHLYFVADPQFGSRSCYRPKLRSDIAEIVEDPYAAVVLGGDLEDEDRPSTRVRRKSTNSDRPEVNERDAEKHRAWIHQELVPIFAPLHTKTKYGIIGGVAGHHWTDLGSLNSVQYIYNVLGTMRKDVPAPQYLGEMMSWLQLRFRRQGASRGPLVLGHVQHGDGGGSAVGSALKKLDRAASRFAGQFFLRAHDCALEAAKTPRLSPKLPRDGGEMEIVCKNVAYLNTGSMSQGFLKTKGRPEYPEQKGMVPVAMGWGCLKVILRRAHPWEDASANLTVDFKVEI